MQDQKIKLPTKNNSPYETGNIFREALERSPYWTSKTKTSGQYINGLVCPACGHTEAFAHSAFPGVIFCHRNNQCGANTKVREIIQLPDFEREYPPTPTDPDAPARSYLMSRGISSKTLNNLTYRYWKDIRNTGRGAVMFKVDVDTWNGRIINPPPGIDKGHSYGKLTGKYWKHPGITYSPDRETFVTEGIIDALSFIDAGYQAIAVIMSGADPQKTNLTTEFRKITFAFDNDPAGSRATKKWKTHYQDAGAVMSPRDSDWNEVLQASGGGDGFRDFFEEKRSELSFNASLSSAISAREYVEIYNKYYEDTHNLRVPGLFEFNNCYYFSSAKLDSKDKKIISVYRVSDFVLRVDHFQRDDNDEDRPVYKYYLKIIPKNGKQSKCVVTADELSTPGSLRTMFLQRSRVVWKGNTVESLALIEKIVHQTNAPVVRQLSRVGFDPKAECYFFPFFMVNSTGAFCHKNGTGFYKLKKDELVRPPSFPSIKPSEKPETPPNKIYESICRSWPVNGEIAFAWMVSSWFVNQIKKRINFFPFLQARGKPSTGKSTLFLALNRCQGFDEEGIPRSDANTMKGELRKIAQKSGLFTAFIEGNETKKGKFNPDIVLPLYNSNPLQLRARFSNDETVNETPFPGAIAFVQNGQLFIERQHKERIIDIIFDSENQTQDTMLSFDGLNRVAVEDFPRVFVEIMKHREKIETEWEAKYKNARETLKEIGYQRIIDNHAIILAFHNIVQSIFTTKFDITDHLIDIGSNKMIECTGEIDTITAQLFDMFVQSYNNDSEEDFFMAANLNYEKGELYIHLPDVERIIANKGFKVGVNEIDLHAHLRRHPAYIRSNHPHRFKYRSVSTKTEKVKKAWVFRANDDSFWQLVDTLEDAKRRNIIEYYE